MIIDLIRNTATIEVRVGPRGPRGEAGQSGASTWSEITGKPSTFPPSSHTHAQSDVTGLVSALTAKADLVGGKVPSAQLPSISLVEFKGAVNGQSAMQALRGEPGDFCFRSDQGLAYFIVSGDGSQLSHWQSVATPGNIGVSSVNGHVGVVVLDKDDIGLGNVDNTSDADKPVSDAQQTALDGKADLETATLTPAAALEFTLTFGGTGSDYVTLYVDIYANDDSVQRFWFYSTTQNNPPPPSTGVTLRQVNIDDGNASDVVASAFYSAFSVIAIQMTAARNSSVVTITADVARAWNDPALSGAGALALTITTHGADAITGPAVLQVQLLNALQAAITDGKITLPDGRYLAVMDAP